MLKKILYHIAVAGTCNRQLKIQEILDREEINYRILTSKFIEIVEATNIEIDLTQYCNPENKSETPVILTAHYDVVKNSTGANDNGSSVAILIALAIHIKKYGSRVPIKIVFFDREETGGIGSATYCQGISEVVEFINLDVCGYGERIVLCKQHVTEEDYSVKMVERAFRTTVNPLIYANRFPFSDATMIAKESFSVLSISVFPAVDVDGMDGEIGFSIFKSMHNSSHDNIKYINFNIMKKLKNILIFALCNPPVDRIKKLKIKNLQELLDKKVK